MSSDNKTSSSSGNASEQNSLWIPVEYEEVQGPGGVRYVVPEFLFPELQQQFLSTLKKKEIGVFDGSGTEHGFHKNDIATIGEGMVMSPTIPGSSDRERLAAHSEILVLQERLGISYKDAAHRLYMAGLEKAKADQKMYTAFTSLEESTLDTLEKARKAIDEMEDDA